MRHMGFSETKVLCTFLHATIILDLLFQCFNVDIRIVLLTTPYAVTQNVSQTVHITFSCRIENNEKQETKNRYGDFSEDVMRSAVDEVKAGGSLRKVARARGLSFQTLARYVTKSAAAHPGEVIFQFFPMVKYATAVNSNDLHSEFV